MHKFTSVVRECVPWIIVAFLSVGLQPSAVAQSSSASLTVGIADTTGAVVPNAGVVIRNMDTNQEQSSMSGKSGSASFSFLKPGRYTLTVSKNTFADIAVNNVFLNVGDEKRLQLVLKIGPATQTVSVDGSGSTLNTTDASVSTVVDRKFVANMPLNGRSFQDLISMTPGVLTQSPQSTNLGRGYNGDFSVNGQRTESNYYTIDGVTGNTGAGSGNGGAQPATAGLVPSSTALGTTQSLLSVDSLQEFRVNSSTYSAEFGRSPGGQFSFVTRSGTNHLHGTAFDYFRNDAFDSNDWFNNYNGVERSALHQNDFGGTLGGPIWIPRLYNGRDRSFFFVSYEGLRLTQPQAASIQYVPDIFLREQAPAVLQPILDSYPQQTGKDYGTPTSPSLAVFTKAYSVPSVINSTGVRLDHTFSPRLVVFFRSNYTPSSTQSRVLAALTSQDLNTQTYTLGATSELTHAVNNEFRVGNTEASSSQSTILDSFGGAQPVDLQTVLAGGSYGPLFGAEPEVYIPGIGNAAYTVGKSKNDTQQWNIVDSISWSHDTHQFKAGLDYLHVRSNVAPYTPFVSPVWESVASVLSNKSYEVLVRKYLSVTPVFHYGAAFIQDEWRVNSRLSVSGGIRWEVDPPPTEAHGNDGYTLLGSVSNPASLSLAPQGTPLWKTTYYNFAPRLGLAWQAHSNRGMETVVRVGGGVFFDSNNWAATQGYTNNAIGITAQQPNLGASLPFTPSQLAFPISATPPFANNYPYAFPSHLQLPYTFQWNASLEQALGERQSLTVSYVAANGRRLIGEQRYSIGTLNPTFSTIYEFNANQTSNYNSLQVKLQRSVAHGLQALVSYVWSHSIDFGSAATQLPTTRSNSDFDVKHNFSSGLAWDLPNTKQFGIANSLVNNWGVDGRLTARTAFPVNLSGNVLTDSLGNQFNGGVNFVAGKPYYVYSNQYPGGRALNPAAFVANASTTQNGDVPRNYFRGFDELQLNLSLRRTFHLTDSTSLQFHVDSFNLPNHPNFGTVNTSLTNALFGQATATLASSLPTVAPQYQQGGPRSFQLSLKLLF